MQVTNKQLSEREQEILRLVATGASNKEIAKELYISTNTVKVHLRNIFAKIGVNSRTEAAMYAVNSGIVPGAKPAGEADLSTSADESKRKTRLRSFVAWSGMVIAVLLGFAGLLMVIRNQAPETGSNNPNLTTALQRWEVKASMPKARYGFAAAAYENQIYAIGGETDKGVVGKVERYDPGSDLWEGLSEKPLAVSDVAGAVIGGKIYVPGGRLPSGDFTNVLEIYDPREDSWGLGSNLPVPLSAYALTAFEGRLYLFGGWDGKAYIDTVYEYDPGSDQWEERSSMPTPRAYAGAAVSAGEIFVIGGINEDGRLSVNEGYLPELDNGLDNPWEKAVSMPDERSAMGVVSVVDNIYVIGGKTGEGGRFPSFIYITADETWQSFEVPSDNQWSRLGLELVGMRLFILGGEYSDEPTDQTMAYQAIYSVSIPVIIK